MKSMSDDRILNGEWHKCVCGNPWSDSDGGPCHNRCDTCGDIVDDETLCGCAIVGIPLRLLRKIEGMLSESPATRRELQAEIDEMREMVVSNGTADAIAWARRNLVRLQQQVQYLEVDRAALLRKVNEMIRDKKVTTV